MDVELNTEAEKRAAKAESLPTFDGLNLLGIKRQVAQVIAQIGKDGIFREYTVHDITHVEEMLRLLDWLIVPNTGRVMTPTDWLLIVLACYFHDAGMVVTKEEFDARSESSFAAFCEERLFNGPEGKEYEAKIRRLPANDAERFLYQEFVRHFHGARIRQWIEGQLSKVYGVASAAADVVASVTRSLNDQFKFDLARVCESHHLDDLSNLDKYHPARAYGARREETGNVQFAAVMLRTADLLHITNDRTPSVCFRLINPTDPVSQREWAKQRAVTRVQRKEVVRPVDTESEVSAHTIEVHAFFQSSTGYFALTSYLDYAQEQIRQSHK